MAEVRSDRRVRDRHVRPRGGARRPRLRTLAQGLTRPVRVASARTRLALITPVRIALGVLLLLAAVARGAGAGPAALAFVVGAGVVAFAALADRRALLLQGDAEPEALPADVETEPSWRVLAAAAYPSTLGVSILGAIALAAGKDVLAALLGGVVAGLGLASGVGLVALVAWERERGRRLHIAADGRRFVS